MKTNQILILPMEYDGKFTVSYNTSDGTSSAFRVIPDVGEKIVRAVNSHEEMLEALKAIYDCTTTTDKTSKALLLVYRAIAKAEGK